MMMRTMLPILALLAVPTQPRVTPNTPAVKAVPALPAVAAKAPRVEVTFVLDTTGSMGGLIEGAKRRIWSIARRIGEGRPRPDLRIALVGYRDKGDAYVTRVHDLSGDMDEVYARLTAFQAEGGGDYPEHVSAALSDAVHRVSWTQGSALRLIFLVGDAPPHTDYQDGFDFRRHVREARQLGIGVETVQCGANAETEVAWREIASMGDGHYAQIDGQGGMPVRVTAADAELARLNAELAATVVAGGSPREQAVSRDRLEARKAMPAAMATEAAGYFARADRLADKDMVDMPVAEQKKALAEAKANAAAPAPLAGKSEAEAVAYLKDQKAKREKVQARIGELQKERDAELAKAPQKDAFDEKVVGALKEKAAAKGIQY
jgi:von Willebrand factor type A domain